VSENPLGFRPNILHYASQTMDYRSDNPHSFHVRTEITDKDVTSCKGKTPKRPAWRGKLSKDNWRPEVIVTGFLLMLFSSEKASAPCSR